MGLVELGWVTHDFLSGTFQKQHQTTFLPRWIYQGVPFLKTHYDTLMLFFLFAIFEIVIRRCRKLATFCTSFNVREVNRITLAAVVTSGSGRHLAKGGVQCALRCLNKGPGRSKIKIYKHFSWKMRDTVPQKKHVLESHFLILEIWF